MRRVSDPGVQRQDEPHAAEPRRQSTSECGALPRRHRSDAGSSPDTILRRQTQGRRQGKARDHPVPQTVHRPGILSPSLRTAARARDHLTNIGASSTGPRPTTVSSRPRSSDAPARGAVSKTSSSPRSNGAIGSTTAACSSPSGISRRPRQKPTSTFSLRSLTWRHRTQTKQPPANSERFRPLTRCAIWRLRATGVIGKQPNLTSTEAKVSGNKWLRQQHDPTGTSLDAGMRRRLLTLFVALQAGARRGQTDARQPRLQHGPSGLP